MPALLPVVKNLSMPACRKLLITVYSGARHVSEVKRKAPKSLRASVSRSVTQNRSLSIPPWDHGTNRISPPYSYLWDAQVQLVGSTPG